MEGLLFGTGGVPLSTRPATTLAGVQRIAELGLSCMEIEFVQRVNMTLELAAMVGEEARRADVTLTVHAPYYINLNAQEAEKVAASRERLLKSARVASIFRAHGVAFHAAFYLGQPPPKVFQTVRHHLEEIVAQLKAEDSWVWLRPEVMGKPSQFGTLEEVIQLCRDVDGLAPCFDFSHWHARTGRFNSYPEFHLALDLIEAGLGRQGLENMHIHLSGIAYGKKGELKHLKLEESDFNYRGLLMALKERQAGGVVICESPSLEEDALLLQRGYRALP